MRNSEFPAFLYVLEDPREPGNIRYIGATQDLCRRLGDYWSDYRRGDHRRPISAWFAGLADGGIKPRMRMLWQGSASEMYEAEVKAIESYQRLGFSLLNATGGGPGGVTAPGRNTFSNWQKKNRAWNLGVPMSEVQYRQLQDARKEWYKTHSAHNKGVPMSAEQKEKLRISKLGKPWTEARRQAHNSRKEKSCAG